MSYRITFVSSAFGENRELANRILQVLLDALFMSNVLYLRANPNTPSIYATDTKHKSLIHYEEEPLGQEDWKDIPTVLRDGFGDCEDLACWRAAELVVKNGIEARPFFTYKERPDGSLLYHIKVRYPDGTVEDPSLKLGMGKHLF